MPKIPNKKKTHQKKSQECGLNTITHKCVKGETKFKGKCKKVGKKCKLKKKEPVSNIELSIKNPKFIKKITYKNITDKHKELKDIPKLKKDIIDIVSKCWKNQNFKKRASYSSEKFSDLFTRNLNKHKNILVIDNEDKDKKKTIFTLNNDDDKRPFMDVATDFNTLHFWQNKITRLLFIYIVLFTFQTMLEEIYKQKIIVNGKSININKNNLNIMFKGGNILRMVIKELIRNFESKTEKYILNLVHNYIKIGDFDFEFISYGLPPAVISKFNMINFIVMMRLRNYLIDHNIFDFFNYNNETIQKKINLLKQKLNKQSKELNDDNWFKNIKIDYIQVGEQNSHDDPMRFNTFQKKYKYRDAPVGDRGALGLFSKETKRIDFAIIQCGSCKTKRNQMAPRSGLIKITDLLKMYKVDKDILKLTTSSRKKGFYLYCTHNSIVNIHNDVGHNFDISFQLNRIKFNYVMYYRKKINGKIYYLKDDIPGEILDLNHTYDEDRKKYKFKRAFNQNKYLKTYTIPKYQLQFFSYSLIGLLDDLEVIIFDEVNFKPWDEIKYKKRLYRILILTFLIYFNQNDGISFKSKLSVIDKMITHISKDDYDLKITDKILKNLFNKLKKVYLKRTEEPTKYKSYKLTLTTILNELNRTFVNQYLTTRNQILTIDNKNISSRTFTL